MCGVRPGLASLILGAILTVGCSAPTDQPEVVEVTGKVTVDSEPLVGKMVVFSPEDGRASIGYTDDEGHYELMYLQDTYGAKPGKHAVSISTPMEDEDDPEAERVIETIPPEYNTKTKLTAEVTADGDNSFDFELKSR